MGTMLDYIDILTTACDTYESEHLYALFSGGHDSLVSTFVASQHPKFKGVIHLNTGIGIEETHEFVVRTCQTYRWSLHEYHAKEVDGLPVYDATCLRLGMPGGLQAHSSQYHRLKEEQLERAIAELIPKGEVIILASGIRRQESHRRMLNAISTPIRPELKLRRVWTAPILDFSALDVGGFISEYELPRNQVVDLLHRSGECLCGALARSDELLEIEFWYPEIGRRIRQLEKACFDKGLRWNWGSKRIPLPPKEQSGMPLCQSCETKWDRMLPDSAADSG